MDIFLAKLLGPVLIVAGLGLLLNRATYQAVAEEVAKNRALLFITGALNLVPGLAIVLAHNAWGPGWRLIITIIGWLLLIRGALRLLIPQQMGDLLLRTLVRSEAIIGVGVVALVVGAFLAWKGFSGSS